MLEIAFNKGSYDAIVSLGDLGDPSQFLGLLNTAMTAGVQEVQLKAKQGAPVRTGNLSRSIRYKVSNEGGGVAGVVGTNVVYARIQEMGGWTGRGYASFIKPRFYLEDAVQSSADYIREQFRKYLTVKKK